MVERTFYKKVGKLYHACNNKKRFSLLQTNIEDITFGLVRMYVMPYRFTLTIFILGLALSYTDKLLVFRLGTNCAPLVADLFLFCYERDFMKYLSSDNQADVITAMEVKKMTSLIHKFFLKCIDQL